MRNYVFQRLVYMVFLLWLVSIVTFVVIQLPPGDYLSTYISRLEQAGEQLSDEDLFGYLSDLGGHDISRLLACLRAADEEKDRPSVVLAYTIKGWGLSMAGDPLNHATLCTSAQIDALREEMGLTLETEWDRFAPDSPEGRICAAVGAEINNPPPQPRPPMAVPTRDQPALAGKTSTQEAFGRTLTRLADVPDVGKRIVTTAPDVSTSCPLYTSPSPRA